MNEDDTFNRLRRIPYDQLSDRMDEESPFSDGYIYDPFNHSEIVWLNKYGWTELEYKKRYRLTLLEDTEWLYLLDRDIERLKNDGR